MFRRFEVVRKRNEKWDVEKYVFDTEECNIESELFEILKDGKAQGISLMDKLWENGRVIHYDEERAADGELLKVTLRDGELEDITLLLNRITRFRNYSDE